MAQFSPFSFQLKISAAVSGEKKKTDVPMNGEKPSPCLLWAEKARGFATFIGMVQAAANVVKGSAVCPRGRPWDVPFPAFG
jgi:hypothetical protein